MKQNLTLVNSDWIGDKVREWHGIESTTLYPPVSGEFPEVPWQNREDGFVCIGRISPEKELDDIIDILACVRKQGHDIHLHLIGSPDHPRYYKRIVRRAKANPSWLFINKNPSRDELVRLVATHRYGIHGMKEEHFGMAVAEMVRGGCIVFVPRGGGQLEIVGNDDRLLYGSVEEAVSKIHPVLKDPDLQNALRCHLNQRKELFSTAHFVRQLREIVRTF